MSSVSSSDNKDYDWLLTRSKTAYELLSLEKLKTNEITLDSIKKSYRKKALILHPDKNKSENAIEEFREISISYLVLSNPELRTKYDLHLKNDQLKIRNKVLINESKNQLKNELLSNELNYFRVKKNKDRLKQKIDYLRNQNNQMKKSKLNEILKNSSNNEKASAAPSIDTKTSNKVVKFSTRIKLKWKNKPQLSSSINPDIIKLLMQVFGEIDSVNFIHDDDSNSTTNYNYANITFHDLTSCILSYLHDYSKTDNLWDELGMRRLASLLRSVKLVGFNNERFDVNQLDFDTYLGLSLLKLFEKDRNKKP